MKPIKEEKSMRIHPAYCRDLIAAICAQAAEDYLFSEGKDESARQFFLHDRLLDVLELDGKKMLELLNRRLQGRHS